MNQLKTILSFMLRMAITLGFFFYIFTALISLQDYVILKDGQKISGKIMAASDVEVRLQKGTGETLIIPITQIRFGRNHQHEIHIGLLTVAKQLDIPIFLMFATLFFGEVFLATFRLKWLLNSQGMDVASVKILKINFIGQFFNNFLPGSTGGDLARAFYLAQDAQSKTKAVVAVIMDRIIGLWALILLACTVLLFQFGKPEFFWPAVVIWSSFGGLIAALMVLFFLPDRLYRSKDGILFRVIAAFCNYRQTPMIFLKTTGISLLIHIASIVAFIGFAWALGVRNVPVAAFCVYVPVGFLLMAVPVSLSGWGVGEAVYSFLFAQVGMAAAQGVAMTLLMRLSWIGIGLIGGVIWLLYRMGRKSATEDL